MRIGRLVYVQKQIEGNVRGRTCLDQELEVLPMCGKAVQQYPLFNELRQRNSLQANEFNVPAPIIMSYKKRKARVRNALLRTIE